MIDVQGMMNRTEDAYSRSRYGDDAWRNSIIQLEAAGYYEEEIHWILFSKYMRWAADRFGVWSGDVTEDGEDVGYMILVGDEIIQYRDYIGIDIERDKNGNPDMS